MNACHLRWNFCLTLQSCCQTCQSCRILASQSSLALPTCLKTCVLRLTAWRLTLLHSSPPTWSTRLGIGVFGVISGRRVLLPCWLNPCLTDKAYVIRSAKIGWQFWYWKRKIFSEIPSNARHAESLLRLTAQSLPDLVPGLNFYWNNNDDFFSNNFTYNGQ